MSPNKGQNRVNSPKQNEIQSTIFSASFIFIYFYFYLLYHKEKKNCERVATTAGGHLLWTLGTAYIIRINA